MKQYTTDETVRKRIGEEIRQAYSDSGRSSAGSRRCLSYLASEFVDLDTARELVEHVPMYNAFHPTDFQTIIDVIQGADIDARIAFAREGSVCVYIEATDQKAGGRVWDILDRMSARPDELNFVAHDNIGSSDILGKGIHNGCDHDEDDAPVPVGQEATPRDGAQVLRAWWD